MNATDTERCRSNFTSFGLFRDGRRLQSPPETGCKGERFCVSFGIFSASLVIVVIVLVVLQFIRLPKMIAASESKWIKERQNALVLPQVADSWSPRSMDVAMESQKVPRFENLRPIRFKGVYVRPKAERPESDNSEYIRNINDLVKDIQPSAQSRWTSYASRPSPFQLVQNGEKSSVLKKNNKTISILLSLYPLIGEDAEEHRLVKKVPKHISPNSEYYNVRAPKKEIRYEPKTKAANGPKMIMKLNLHPKRREEYELLFNKSLHP